MEKIKSGINEKKVGELIGFLLGIIFGFGIIIIGTLFNYNAYYVSFLLGLVFFISFDKIFMFYMKKLSKWLRK